VTKEQSRKVGNGRFSLTAAQAKVTRPRLVEVFQLAQKGNLEDLHSKFYIGALGGPSLKEERLLYGGGSRGHRTTVHRLKKIKTDSRR